MNHTLRPVLFRKVFAFEIWRQNQFDKAGGRLNCLTTFLDRKARSNQQKLSVSLSRQAARVPYLFGLGP